MPGPFERVRARARATVEDVEAELYLITAGYAEILEGRISPPMHVGFES